jgi:hypothetical protein
MRIEIEMWEWDGRTGRTGQSGLSETQMFRNIGKAYASDNAASSLQADWRGPFHGHDKRTGKGVEVGVRTRVAWH